MASYMSRPFYDIHQTRFYSSGKSFEIQATIVCETGMFEISVDRYTVKVNGVEIRPFFDCYMHRPIRNLIEAIKIVHNPYFALYMKFRTMSLNEYNRRRQEIKETDPDAVDIIDQKNKLFA